ncbi:FUSC family protein [Streptococcus sp. zg-JUN1979]|uniref:FUSC family protein n=1 Tax=Streptococcus sp. zg-JUN1979 TaxID=3391450 RepID=UPI0039A4BA32
MLKKYKFDLSKFHLGMRTLKTGLAVFIVLLVFHFFDWEGLQIGALTAVFSLREDFDKSIHFGLSRIVGNSIGGLLSLIFFLLKLTFHEAFWVTLFVVPLLTMLCIMINVAIDNKAGIIGAVSALLIITLSIPTGNTIIYVFTRIFETFCGVFVATLVNTDIDWLRQKILKKENKSQ